MAWSKLSRHERGYDSKWTKLRLTILARDLHLCQTCAALGRPTPATEVDHRIPKAKGGTDDPGNLMAICSPCHKAKSLAEAAQAQGRTIKPRPQFDAAGRVVW